MSIGTDPYLLPYKHGSMPIGHSVKTSFRIIYEVSILHLCTVSNPLPLRRILDHGNTPDHNWKLKIEKKFAVGFDEM